MNFVEKSAKTIEEAVKLALEELSIREEDALIETLEHPIRGFLGFGSKPARVKVTKKEVKNAVVNPIISEDKKVFEKEPANGEEIKEMAHNFLREVLVAMDVKAEIRLKIEENVLMIKVAGPKMGQLIGRRGQTLDSLQYLTSLVVNKGKGKEHFMKVILDTEDYRAKREETLIRLANRIASQVVKTGKSVRLEPMNPYERRIIHAALQGYAGITTFSEGEEPYRKVVIARR